MVEMQMVKKPENEAIVKYVGKRVGKRVERGEDERVYSDLFIMCSKMTGQGQSVVLLHNLNACLVVLQA